MVVSAETNKVSYAGNGSTTSFSTSFTFASNDEVTVTSVVTATGVETEFTLGTEYTLTGAGTGSAGTVTIATSPSDFTPASGTKLVIQLKPDFTQTTDLPRGGTVSPADTLEPMHDSRVRQMLRLKDEIDRSLKLPIDETSAAVLQNATLRAGKILSFNSSTGAPETTQEFGTFRGNWSASTSYVVRDLVKDTSTNNIFQANTAHTSSGSQPLTTNTDSAKWDLIVDAASATTSATNAAASATAAASSATSASSSASSASSSSSSATSAKNDAETAKAAAETAQAAAEAALDNFDDTYLGAKSSDPATDNDGDALNAGDLYFNTSSNVLKVYNGSAWQVAATSTAGLLAVANNLSDLNNAGTARTNLGLGTAATLTAGTSANNAVQLTGSAALPAVSGASLTGVGLTGVHQIWVPAVAISPTATGGAEAYSSTNSSGPDLTGLKFDGSSEESADFSIAAFNALKTSATMTFTPYWISDASTNGCVWGFKAVAVADGEDIDAASFGSEVTSSDVGQSSATELLKGPTSGACTVAGLGAAGELIYIRVSRKVADGSDTISGDTTLIGVLVALETDTGNDA